MSRLREEQKAAMSRLPEEQKAAMSRLREEQKVPSAANTTRVGRSGPHRPPNGGYIGVGAM
jgi:hypothetical protein